jgi:non-ribosomal peptide synthase protein (TIGR01720 family)
VGPGRTLASLGREAARSVGTDAIASFETDNGVHAAGQLWLSGVTIEWPAFHGGERRRRVAGLPTYPFERQRYWIEMAPAAAPAIETSARLPLDAWFSTPAWTSALASPEPLDAEVQDGAWVIFGDRGVLADTIAKAIVDRGGTAIQAISSDRFAEVAPDLFEIRAHDRGDYFTLFESLARNAVRVRRIVHTWPALEGDAGPAAFSSLLSLVQAVGQHFAEAPLTMALVTTGAHDVTGAETLQPSAALAVGAVRVVPMEYRNLSCVAVDVDGHRTDGDAVVRESIAAADPIVALRGGRKWVQTFRSIALPSVAGVPARLRARGVYLITGGTGGVGIELARYLARALQARLVLTGRSVTPSARAATEIAALEAAGADVIYLQADAADPAAMKAAIATAIARFGELNGVIHAAGADKTACAIHEIDAARCADQFRPRIAALAAMQQAVAGLDLDFVAVQSSLSSVLGAAGHLPYTAGHLYMDAFAQRANRDAGTPWIVINWDNWTTWKSAPVVRRDEYRVGMTAAEGAEAFARVLGSHSATHVIVSSEDLARRTVKIPAEADGETAAGAPARATALHPRPALRSEYVAPATGTQIVLASIWEELLGIGGIGVHDNFFELGGDSVTSIQVVARAGARGLRITTRQAFELPTIAELAEVATGSDTRAVSQEVVTGPVPLTPIQRWFFDQNLADPHHFNQAVLLEVDRAIDIDLLVAAVRTVSARHDALRLRFVRERGSWHQSADRAPAIHVARVDLTHVAPGELQDAIELTAAEAQGALDLASGRLLTLTWMDLGPRRPARLLIIAHHLVIDAISWGVLLEELYLALDQSARGEPVSLPPVTTPFQGWARALAERAGAADLTAEVEYWTGQQWHRAAPLPSNGPAHANTVASSFRLTSSLTADETSSLIHDSATLHNAQAQELLLTALHQTLSAWTGGGPLHVHLEGHGRDGIVDGVDLSRTIGWFTTMYPVLLDVASGTAAADAVAAVKRQLRAVPNGGIGFGVLKYLAPDAAVRRQMARVPEAAVSFLYMGRGDQASPAHSWMRSGSEPIGQMRSLRGRRAHAIDVIASVIRGQLQVTWTFSEALHHRATVEALSQGFLDALRGIVAARPGSAPTLTAEEFPAARLEQDELERLLSTIKIGGTN